MVLNRKYYSVFLIVPFTVKLPWYQRHLRQVIWKEVWIIKLVECRTSGGCRFTSTLVTFVHCSPKISITTDPFSLPTSVWQCWFWFGDEQDGRILIKVSSVTVESEPRESKSHHVIKQMALYFPGLLRMREELIVPTLWCKCIKAPNNQRVKYFSSSTVTKATPPSLGLHPEDKSLEDKKKRGSKRVEGKERERGLKSQKKLYVVNVLPQAKDPHTDNVFQS